MIRIKFKTPQIFLANKEQGGCLSLSEITCTSFSKGSSTTKIKSMFNNKPYTYEIMNSALKSIENVEENKKTFYDELMTRKLEHIEIIKKQEVIISAIDTLLGHVINQNDLKVYIEDKNKPNIDIFKSNEEIENKPKKRTRDQLVEEKRSLVITSLRENKNLTAREISDLFSQHFCDQTKFRSNQMAKDTIQYLFRTKGVLKRRHSKNGYLYSLAN